MKPSNSSSVWKRVACPDTTCSTRPAQHPASTSVAAPNCTTNARWAKSGGSAPADCITAPPSYAHPLPLIRCPASALMPNACAPHPLTGPSQRHGIGRWLLTPHASMAGADPLPTEAARRRTLDTSVTLRRPVPSAVDDPVRNDGVGKGSDIERDQPDGRSRGVLNHPVPLVHS